MSENPAFRRVLLKLSGEALKGHNDHGLSGVALAAVAGDIRSARETGAELAVVVGGGNFFRGVRNAVASVERTTADSIGMLATVMNGLALRDALVHAGLSCTLMSAFHVTGVTEPFDPRIARNRLAAGDVVVCAGGTGHAYFTTDTTAALRACELDADAIVKATRVDGVYSADPEADASATRYTRLHYQDALDQRLAVMDSTAFSLCMDNEIPIVVFDFRTPGNLNRILRGDMTCGTVVGTMPTEKAKAP